MKKKSPRAVPKRKGAAPTKAPAVAVAQGAARLSVALDAAGFESVIGAAYLMTDRAYVRLGGDRKKTVVVELAPRPGAPAADALAREFADELATQKVRWKLARDNQPIREFIAEQAVLMANGSIETPSASQSASETADAPDQQLSDAQRLEIEKLIAEVEDEIKQMNAKKTVADPKNIKASWEEKQGAAPQENA